MALLAKFWFICYLNLGKVKLQQTDFVCFYDFQMYLNAGTYTVQQNSTGKCMESYAYTMNSGKVFFFYVYK